MSDRYGRVAQGWKIGIFCYKFLLRNKKLLVFPVLSALSLVVAIAIVFAKDAFVISYSAGTGTSLLLKILGLYFFCIFSVLFFNVATISVTNSLLNGEANPSLFSGVKVSCSKIIPILLWAIFSGTIGLFLSALNELEERTFIPILSMFLQIAWAIVVYFVVPVICFTSITSPFALIKASKETIKKFWSGKNFRRILGVTALGIVLIIPAFILGNIAYHLPRTVWQTPLYYLTGVYLLVLSAFNFVAGAVWKTIFYRYLAEGFIAPGLTAEMLEHALVKKI